MTSHKPSNIYAVNLNDNKLVTKIYKKKKLLQINYRGKCPSRREYEQEGSLQKRKPKYLISI